MNKYENPTFCYLGRLMPYKNIDVLLKSLQNVVKTIPNAKLIIAGKGSSDYELKTLSDKLGISKQVEFKGYVSENEKREILARSWILVQPSSFEGWGITVIEANASHTPVIASNTAGLRDSVLDGQTGILVKTMSLKLKASNFRYFSETIDKNNKHKRAMAKALFIKDHLNWLFSMVVSFFNLVLLIKSPISLQFHSVELLPVLSNYPLLLPHAKSLLGLILRLNLLEIRVRIY